MGDRTTCYCGDLTRGQKRPDLKGEKTGALLSFLILRQDDIFPGFSSYTKERIKIRITGFKERGRW